MTDFYVADGGEPVWVTAAWFGLKYLVVFLALRLPAARALLATVGMVITSTFVLMVWELVLPTSWRLLPLVVIGLAVETGVEAAFLVWAFRLAWSWRSTLLFAANAAALVLSVVTAAGTAIDNATSAYVLPPGATKSDLLRAAGGPTLERPVDGAEDVCPAGSIRAVEYHVPAGLIARLFPLSSGSPGTVVTVCLDERNTVVKTEMIDLD